MGDFSAEAAAGHIGGRPSPRLPSGISASSGTRRRASMPVSWLPRVAAAAVRLEPLMESRAIMTRRGLPGRSGWHGWVRRFRWRVPTVVAISGRLPTAGRSRLPSNRSFASGRRPGWPRPRETSSCRIWVNCWIRHTYHQPGGRRSTGVSCRSPMVLGRSSNHHRMTCR